jgi:hypothetical protein
MWTKNLCTAIITNLGNQLWCYSLEQLIFLRESTRHYFHAAAREGCYKPTNLFVGRNNCSTFLNSNSKKGLNYKNQDYLIMFVYEKKSTSNSKKGLNYKNQDYLIMFVYEKKSTGCLISFSSSKVFNVCMISKPGSSLRCHPYRNIIM